MEFNQLIADFAKRHNVENLVAVDESAAAESPALGSSDFIAV